MKGLKGKKRLAALIMSMALLISSVPAFAAEDTGQTVSVTNEEESISMGEEDISSEIEDTEIEKPETSESEKPEVPESAEPETPEVPENTEPENKEAPDSTEPETPQVPDDAESKIPEAPETVEPPEEAPEEIPEDPLEEFWEALPEVELPYRTALREVSSDIPPEHHKYIKYNGGDSYTLTLDVKGMYNKETSKRKLDVLLIVDQSGSMKENYGEKSRLGTVKDIVTGANGLSRAILSNEAIDGHMALVSYSGNDGENDWAWNDAWEKQNWTASKAALDSAVKGLLADGGTNCQAGLYTGAQVLANARSDAQKIVIFLSDGEPTFRYDSRGRTQGSGNSDRDGQNARAAYEQAAAISGLSGFYTVGISNDSKVDFLTTLAGKPGAEKSGAYMAAHADDLVDVFEKIIADITEYTCRNVVITDKLSDYVQIPEGTGFTWSVTAKNESGEPVDVSQIGIQVNYDAASKTVRAEFPKDYNLQENLTYRISFEVEPTQKAYDEYANQMYLNGGSGYPHTGSAGSDAPGNSTSSGKPGFYSNDEAKLQYTYGKKEALSNTVNYAEKPVVQVSSRELPVEKRWENIPDGAVKPEVTVHLYQDGKEEPYRTLTLNEGNEWKGVFPYLPKKGHVYSVGEVEVPGYESSIFGDSESGFIITNTHKPSLTITKKVVGEMGDWTKEFHFTVVLKDKNGNPLSGNYPYIRIESDGTQTSGEISLQENGECEIQLSHKDSFTISMLPVGASYKVSETDGEGYTVSYEASDEGNLVNGDVKVTVINTRESIPATGIENRKKTLPLKAAMAMFAGGIFCIVSRRRFSL